MYMLDTIEQLVHHGMNPRKARTLVLTGFLPMQLIVPNQTSNLELLAAHADLNDCDPNGLKLFLFREYSVNQRMEAVPGWFDFPEEQAARYLSDPLQWRFDIYDGLSAREALKTLTDDAETIRSILIYMFTNCACMHTEEFLATCRQLSRINTNQAAMDALLKNFDIMLFSTFACTVDCIDRLVNAFGVSDALEALMSCPNFPVLISRSNLRNLSDEEFIAQFRPRPENQSPVSRPDRSCSL